jgi:hypothetical protein
MLAGFAEHRFVSVFACRHHESRDHDVHFFAIAWVDPIHFGQSSLLDALQRCFGVPGQPLTSIAMRKVTMQFAYQFQ